MFEEQKFIQMVKDSVFGPLPKAIIEDDIAILADVPYAVNIGYRNLNLNYYSSSADSSVKPLVIWIHGGAFMLGTRKAPPPFLTVENTFFKLVRAGFNVAAIDYRFSGEAKWPAQLEDTFDAITWLQTRSDELRFDRDRIALWGESAGAHIAANAGIRFNNEVREDRNGRRLSPIAAVVDWYGPTDFLLMDKQAGADSGQSHDDPQSPESRLIGAPIQSVPELVANANPVNFVSEKAPAFHIRHGQNDRLVAIGQSEILVDALREKEIEVDFVAIPGADHGFEGLKDSHLLVDEGISYLKSRFSI